MIAIGVDPGLKGAIAATDGKRVAYLLLADCYDEKGERIVYDKFYTALHTVRHALPGGGGLACIGVERQQAMKREGRTQGVSSTFKTAINYGLILAMCDASTSELYDFHPKTWRRWAGITVEKGGDPKAATIRRVKSLFPLINLRPGEGRRKKRTDHDGIADAAGIAFAAWQKFATENG